MADKSKEIVQNSFPLEERSGCRDAIVHFFRNLGRQESLADPEIEKVFLKKLHEALQTLSQYEIVLALEPPLSPDSQKGEYVGNIFVKLNLKLSRNSDPTEALQITSVVRQRLKDKGIIITHYNLISPMREFTIFETNAISASFPKQLAELQEKYSASHLAHREETKPKKTRPLFP